MRLFIITGLSVLFLCSSARAQGMGLLGVDAQQPVSQVATAPTTPPPEPTWEEKRALELAISRARDDLKRARERLESLETSLPGYAPGGYWERHYRREVADWERSLAFSQAEVRKSRSTWSRFKRFMNTDILTGEVVGSRDDWAADSHLRLSTERLAQARRELARIPEDYASMTKSRDEVKAQIPQLEAALAPLEAQRQALNARGIRITWDDPTPGVKIP